MPKRRKEILQVDDDFELPQEQEEDASPAETQEPETSKKKKVTSNEEEEVLYDFEKNMLNDAIVPETVTDFERLIVATPNSAIPWLRLIAFHLRSSEIEKARAVGNRALQTINFREEKEKFDIWVALLNMENIQGTPDTLRTTYHEAFQSNDEKKIAIAMAAIYEGSKKHKEAEVIYKNLTKRIRTDKNIWISFGHFYYRVGYLTQARSILTRCKDIFAKKDFAEITTRFANFEFDYGDKNKGKDMFETLLSTYPKRTDIWRVYIDKLLKSGDVEGARWICERAVNLDISARKIRILFKKYIDLENRFGSYKTKESVKTKALQYINSKN